MITLYLLSRSSLYPQELYIVSPLSICLHYVHTKNAVSPLLYLQELFHIPPFSFSSISKTITLYHLSLLYIQNNNTTASLYPQELCNISPLSDFYYQNTPSFNTTLPVFRWQCVRKKHKLQTSLAAFSYYNSFKLSQVQTKIYLSYCELALVVFKLPTAPCKNRTTHLLIRYQSTSPSFLFVIC